VLLLVPLVALPTAQLAAPNRFGRTILCTESDTREFEKLAEAVSHLPKPIFTNDEIFSLPWHSSDGHYPAIVVDPTLYGIAKREGFLANDFPRRLFTEERVRTVMQLDGHADLSALRASGSLCRKLPGSSFGLEYTACSVGKSAK
jgi:hypothetical protein